MAQDNEIELIETAKQQLQSMIDLNPECMMMLDKERRVIRANRALVDLVGAGSFDNVLSKPLQDLLGLKDLDPLNDLFREHDLYGTCRHAVELHGDMRTLEFARVGGDRLNETVFVVVADISDKLLKDKAAEKQHKQTAVRQMLGAMMHHLNQPLTVIMLRANILATAVNQGRHDDAQVLDALEEISEMAMKLAELLSRIEASKQFDVQNYTDGIDIMKIDDD